jgi:hypothetical protein
MAYTETTVLGIVKARLNRLASDTSLDGYLKQRIEAAAGEITRKGIHLVETSVDDATLLADYTAWKYGSRDKPGGMPEWLRLAIRERWLAERGTVT